MNAVYSALDHVCPELNYARRGADPLTDEGVCKVAGKDFFAGLLLLEAHPDVLMFADRDGGYQFLLKILRAAGLLDAPFEHNEKIGVALQDISRRTGTLAQPFALHAARSRAARTGESSKRRVAIRYTSRRNSSRCSTSMWRFSSPITPTCSTID